MLASTDRIVPEPVFTDAIPGERRPRWLLDVSASGLEWTIGGGLRTKKDTRKINFDIVLPDGSQLTQFEGGSFLELAMAYAARFRVIHPEATSGSHGRRISDLLTFLCWMNLHHIRSISRLTRDHVELFTSKMAYGKEWALEIPHRVIRHIGSILAQGSRPENAPRYLHRIARGLVYQAIHERQGNNHPMGSAVLDWYDTADWVVEDWSRIDVVMNKAAVRPKSQTWAALQISLLPIDELYLWKKYLPGDSVSFVPFPRGTNATARALGVDTRRTPTIPPRVAFNFLSLAIRWVIEVAPVLHAFREGQLSLTECEKKLREFDIRLEIRQLQHIKIWEARMYATPEGLTRMLAAACFAVIAGLSARRLEEIKDLGAGCVTRDSDGHCWITIYIEKTLRRYELVPVPAIVQKAVECLERLSKEARDNTATDSLWQSMRNGVAVPLDGDQFLNVLADLGGGKSTTDDSATWNFTPRQFRRFFAMVYFWRYDRGELGALSHHLRHFDLEMTKRYVTDVQGTKIFAEIAGLWRASLLRDIVAGRKPIGGLAATRLKVVASKLMKQFRKVVDVVVPERIAARLLRLADRLGVEFRQHIWGTICACPSKTKFASQAKCKGKQALGPVFKNATEHLCANCPFAIHTSHFRDAARAAQSRTSMCSRPGVLLQELSKIQFESLEDAIATGDPTPLAADGIAVQA
jgi:hypothetical protein